MVCCVHHIPGRARFKIEALRADAELARTIEDKVAALDGVAAVEVNRHAASVVVHYCPETGEIDEITDHICTFCPKAALNRRVPEEARLAAAAVKRRSQAAAGPVANTDARPAPDIGKAVREAAAKALIRALVTRAVG